MALAKKKHPDRIVFYCPLDFSWAVRRAIQRIRPNLLVLVELELWPNLIRAAKEAGTRVAVVNGRLSEHSFRGYRRLRPFIAHVLAQIDLVAAQDATCAERFRQLGACPELVQVTGSMKYDGAETDPGNPHSQRLGKLAGFSPKDVIFLAGSTQEPEEELALAVYDELRGAWPNLRLVLVPRHPERFAAVARLLDQSGLPWRRRTELLDVRSTGFSRNPGEQPPKGGTTNGASPAARSTTGTERAGSEPRILLVDSVGELGAWWGTAKIAFVGGSLGNRGGQNMIEPAAYGAAVSFGPNTRNFRDIVAAMVQAEAAVVVHDRTELSAFVRRCLVEPEHAALLGGRARDLVAGQLGATDRTLRLLESLLKPPSDPTANPHARVPNLQ
jgi:3-deoxy-D-manno-octulosonic-acid transferase